MIRIPGLESAKVSEEIAMPDVGQLLLEPFFFDVDIHDAYRYGSDFQRYLIDSIPNLGQNHDVVSVMCEVRLLGPDYRACTVPTEDNMNEWHIDDEVGIDGDSEYNWAQPGDIVHLYTNQTSAMTEFLRDDLILPDLNPEDFDYDSFMDYLRSYVSSEKPALEKMPANRIVSFTNQAHRATNPQNYEFRYMFRVTETNRSRPAGGYDPEGFDSVEVVNLDGETELNVERDDSQITIVVPGGVPTIQARSDWEPKVTTETNIPTQNKETTVFSSETNPPEPELPTTEVEPVQSTTDDDFFDPEPPKPRKLSKSHAVDSGIPNNPSRPFTSMNVDLVAWSSSLIHESSDLKKFSPKESIMLISKGKYSSTNANNNLLTFFQKTNKSAKLIDVDTQEEIQGRLKYDFYEEDRNLGPIAGCHITFNKRDTNKLQSGHKYQIELNENSEYTYVIPEDLVFEMP